MFVRNGNAVGSILKKGLPTAAPAEPAKKKRGRPRKDTPKTVTPRTEPPKAPPVLPQPKPKEPKVEAAAVTYSGNIDDVSRGDVDFTQPDPPVETRDG